MLRRGVVGRLRLHQRGLRSVQVAARNGTFGKELLAAVHDALVQIEIGLGLREIQFGLLRIFRHLRLGRRVVGGLRGLVGALVVQRRRGQIGVLKHGEQARPAFTRAPRCT